MLPLPVMLQSWAAVLIQLIRGGNAALCHPVVTAFQFHSIVPGLLLGTLWLLSGLIRLKELKRQRRKAFASVPRDGGRGSYTKLAEQQEAGSKALPGVSIILPVRGCRSHSLSNWQAVLDLHYDGPLEFIFVLESKLDPAHAAITQLLLNRQQGPSKGFQPQSKATVAEQHHPQSEHQQHSSEGHGVSGGGDRSSEERTHRVVFSGAATRTSQKIHK